MPVTFTRMKSDVADGSARVHLTPEGTRAPRRVRRDVRDHPLAQKDARDLRPGLEVVSDPHRAPNVASVPRLVRKRVRDRLAAKDVNLAVHTAADMHCISSSLKF